MTRIRGLIAQVFLIFIDLPCIDTYYTKAIIFCKVKNGYFIIAISIILIIMSLKNKESHMLKKLRKKKTAKKVWITLAIIIVPAFLLWGLGDAIRSRQEANFAGKIFGKKISFLEYKNALDAVKNQAIMQFGDNFSEIQKYLNLESQAWERLILLQEAKKRQINAGDKEVIALIENYPFFQRNNRFDNKVYSEMLRYIFHTQPRIFEEQIRQNLIISKLYKQATNNIKLNEEEIKKEYQKQNEEVSIYYIAGIPSDFVKEISPSQEQVKDYFAKNMLQFKQPPSFNLDYITLDSEDKIKEVILRLNKKIDFNKIAKDLELTIKETGLFSQTDPIPGIGWSPEILNLISKFKIGQYSEPLRVDKYWYILKLKEKRESYIADFEKIKDKVKEKLIKDESEKIAKVKIEECLKKLKELYQLNPKSVDFEKCAKEYGLKSDSTKPFKFGSYIEGIGASDDFWKVARDLKDEEFSKVIATPSGFYIAKLKSRIPIDEKKFESEKAEFNKRLLLQKKEEYFTKFLEELKRKALMKF